MATPTNKEHFSGGLAKVLAEKWQVDVMLKAKNSDEGSAISAHKLILASRSEVFRKMLVLDEFKTSTKQVETITLPNLAVEIMKASLTCTAVSCSNCGYYNNPLSGSCCNCGRFGTLRWISVVSL